MEKIKTIYDLNLNETMSINEKFKVKSMAGTMMDVDKNYDVTRVPGGWIYAMDFPGVRQTNCVFVPFNNEFMVVEKVIKVK